MNLTHWNLNGLDKGLSQTRSNPTCVHHYTQSPLITRDQNQCTRSFAIMVVFNLSSTYVKVWNGGAFYGNHLLNLSNSSSYLLSYFYCTIKIILLLTIITFAITLSTTLCGACTKNYSNSQYKQWYPINHKCSSRQGWTNTLS